MGAEVIRVERPAGEEERNFGPFAPNGQAMLALVTLQNRKGITLDPMCGQGRGIMERLVRKSDVVLHSYVSGSPEESLLSYGSLVKLNPAIIVAKVSGFGSTGPYAQRPCFDTIAQALSGSMSYTGFPETAPTRSGSAWVDFSTGSHAALGIMFALYERQRTGTGQFIDVALLDVAVSCVAGLAVAAEYKVAGIVRGRQGNYSYYNYTNCVRARDGWVMIGITGTAIWRRFLRAVGREELKEDPRFQSDRLRYDNRLAIQAIVEEWLKDRPVDEVIRLLEKARVPCSKVNSIAEMVEDPQVRARDMLIDMEYPGIGRVPLPGVPIKMSRTPGTIDMPAPQVGEHNAEVYGRLLGLTKEDLAGLKAEGVI